MTLRSPLLRGEICSADCPAIAAFGWMDAAIPMAYRYREQLGSGASDYCVI
jgi:hypothetical protein